MATETPSGNILDTWRALQELGTSTQSIERSVRDPASPLSQVLRDAIGAASLHDLLDTVDDAKELNPWPLSLDDDSFNELARMHGVSAEELRRKHLDEVQGIVKSADVNLPL